METIRGIGGEVSTDGDFLIFEGNRYSRKGFLFKNFAMSAIVSMLWAANGLRLWIIEFLYIFMNCF